MTPTEIRYDQHHERIIDLKEAVGESFWALGEELMRMQRECRECGYLPFGDEFSGNQRKARCPNCNARALGLYKIHHKRFSDYLKHINIHRQTAYRKIAVYETYEPLVPVVTQYAPPDFWQELERLHANSAQIKDEDAKRSQPEYDVWVRRYLSRIGWTVLESIQKRISRESDKAQIVRIIEEAAESTRNSRGAERALANNFPFRKRIESLRSTLSEVERCLKEAQHPAAREWLGALSRESSRLAAEMGDENAEHVVETYTNP